jgi:hypothetical protein
MTSITSSPVRIGISPHAVPSTPSWFGEVAAFAQVLEHTGILKAIQEQVRFARARFGHYDVITSSLTCRHPSILNLLRHFKRAIYGRHT